MEPQDFIQKNIYQHGRIQKVRLLSGNEYAVQYADGHADVVSDPRIGSEGPIQSVNLNNGPDQMLTTNFADLASTAIFVDERWPDKAPLPKTRSAAKRQREFHHS
jgi:hypothetical protein